MEVEEQEVLNGNAAETGLAGNGHLNHLAYLNIPLSKDTPDFVSWNWPLIRKCTFFVFMSSLLAMVAIVIAMIATLPTSCNPKTAWYRGFVFYEIFPPSFQDSNKDGIGDLLGIRSRIEYLEKLGVRAVRLNSIFSSPHYPEDFNNVTSLTEIDHHIGTISDFELLVQNLNQRNISLILDLPIYPYLKKLGESTNWPNFVNESSTTTTMESILSESVNPITLAMKYWIALGVSGFYIKGLENFANDVYLIDNLSEWKSTLGNDRALIVSDSLIKSLDKEAASKVINYVDLVDVHVLLTNGTTSIENHINDTMKGVFAPTEAGPWIHWSLGGVGKERPTRGVSANITLASILMQLMLPGTPSIFYGDEIALDSLRDLHNEHSESRHLHHLSIMQWNNGAQFTSSETLPWLPKGATATFQNFEDVSKMIKLRDRSPALYKNHIEKNSELEQNTVLHHIKDNVLIVERRYPRRHTFVSVTNFGNNNLLLDVSSNYYSGLVMIGRTRNEKVYFDKFSIGPMETIVVKLDK
ncbi:hypothetical protein ACFFRR_004538 [Megaselia abdita]